MTSLSSRHGSLSNHFDSSESSFKSQRSSSVASISNNSNLKPHSYINELISNDSNNYIEINEPFHRIYIFDFDDTIFPTSIIQKNTRIWNATELSTISEYKQCNTLYTTIKLCIEYIINLRNELINKYGKNNISFVIITNASSDWFNDIKTNHSQLIAQLIHKLQLNIQIISAKDEFELKYDDWYSECSIIAKTDSIINYIKSIKNKIKNKIPIIYSIGDAKTEFEASQNACYELYNNKYNILYRIQLKTNRKSNNKTFKSLSTFYNTLSKTKQFLFHNNKQLKNILENININTDTDSDSDCDDSDSESMRNIIDYKL
eukprot:373192_1